MKLVPTVPLPRAKPYDAYAPVMSAISFDATGGRLMCTTSATDQSIWSAKTMSRVWHGEGLVALHPDGKQAIFAHGPGMMVRGLKAQSGEEIAASWRTARIASDGRSLVARTTEGAAAFDLVDGTLAGDYRGDAHLFDRTRDGVLVVVTGSLAFALVRGDKVTQVHTSLRPSPPVGLSVTPDGRRALAWNKRGDAALVDIARGELVCVRREAFAGMDRGIALLDDGVRVVIGAPYVVHDLETEYSTPIGPRDPNREQPKTVRALGGDRFAMLVVRPADAYLEIWDAKKHVCLAKTTSVSGVCAVHGDRVAVDRDGAPVVYRFEGGKR